MIYTLRNEWFGNSGLRWTNLVTFKVTDTCVFVYSQSADGNGRILSESSNSYGREQARRHFKRCLADGFKLIDNVPALTYH